MEIKHIDNEYAVLDDFMPPSLVNHIEQVMMFNDNLAWGFRDTTAGVDDIDTDNENIKETFQFQSNLYDHDSGPTSPFFSDVQPIMFFAEHALHFTTQNVSRIKANTLVQVAGAEGNIPFPSETI